MRSVNRNLSFALGLIYLASPGVFGQTIRVSAGEFDRVNTIVSFDLPEKIGVDDLVLIGEGETLPVQVDASGDARFVLPSLAAGQSATYSLEAASSKLAILASKTETGIVFSTQDLELLAYQKTAGPLPRDNIDAHYARGGYLHPVNTPQGRTVTDDYPLNHVHHHGIWAAWTNTEFAGRTPDFWNMAAETGTVLVDSVSFFWSGAVHAGVTAHHRYVDLNDGAPVDALLEEWKVRAYGVLDRDRPYQILDLELHQTTASTEPLILPEYRYGGVGFRGAWDWNGPDNTEFLTSEGRDRSDGHATRARWCHIGGPVEKVMAGITMMDHPENYRAPQPMRIHPTEPFFNYAPSQAGDWSIEPDQPLTLRYRFVVYDGRPDSNELDQLWNDYAHPPVVEVLP